MNVCLCMYAGRYVGRQVSICVSTPSTRKGPGGGTS